MHVRGTVALGLGEDAVHHLDHGRVVVDYLGGRPLGLPLAGPLDLDEGLDQVLHAPDGAVAAVDGPLHVALGREDEVHRPTAGLRELGTQLLGGPVRDGHDEGLVVRAQRHHQESPCHVLGHERQGLGCRVLAPEVDHGERQDLSEHAVEIALAEDTHLDEDLPDPLPRLVLVDPGLADLRLVDQPARDQQVRNLLLDDRVEGHRDGVGAVGEPA